MKISVYDNNKKKMEDIDLDDELFGVEVNVPLLHQVVQSQLATKRQGTASTKTRENVAGSTRKLFKQKGTGNARPGSSKSPLQYGGGIVFGPHPRDFYRKVNKKMFKNALRSAISDRIKSGAFYILDNMKFQSMKTKNVSNMLKSFEIKNCLIVDNENNELMVSARNMKNVTALKPEQINPYDIIKHENIIISKAALEKVKAQIAQE
ncbi:MAG: 50S ribosomal protein L4 [Pseudomonadota bacterium]